MKKILPVFVLFFSFLSLVSGAEDGSRLWLRYQLLPDTLPAYYASQFQTLVADPDSPIRHAAITEFEKAFSGLTGKRINQTKGAASPSSNTFRASKGRIDAGIHSANGLKRGSLFLGTLKDKLTGQFLSAGEVEKCGDEGYLIRTVSLPGGSVTLVVANTDAGLLYGTFALIRLMQMGEPVGKLDTLEVPKYNLRLLDHWDNLDGTVERGYAGHSIWWNQEESEEVIRERYINYARANASVGINGAVLNNVNASPEVLTGEYIHRYAEIAAMLRPYHIKVYMSVNFSSPVLLDHLQTADPLNQDVANWWKKKAEEIYRLIPDFGGFLVKANSEGQPGPQDFGRTHADGANMLAAALEPHGGVVMWRAFVYSPSDTDRARQAYDEFVPLDGKFAANVIVQVKNGPIDFQPREPFSPVFGAMQHTPVMIEFQITQEYLGFSDHLVYLAPLQKECLESDTWCKGPQSTVAKATDGTLFPARQTAIAGVANIGRDTNWCGYVFDQANWYAFGRLAWDHELSSREIAREWIKMTFSHSSEFIDPAVDIMMRSREAAVNYMTPMGLAHLMGWGHHHGPEPWCEVPGARPDWLPSYYHKAAKDGIGFDRTEQGSKAVDQYFSPVREFYNNLETCPDNLLLWFHHLPWDYTMKSGKTLWEELCYHYYSGVDEVRLFQKKWDAVEGLIDEDRFLEVQRKLKVQANEAVWWRDACLLYFQTYAHEQIPLELERPVHDLAELKKLKFNLNSHN